MRKFIILVIVAILATITLQAQETAKQVLTKPGINSKVPVVATSQEINVLDSVVTTMPIQRQIDNTVKIPSIVNYTQTIFTKLEVENIANEYRTLRRVGGAILSSPILGYMFQGSSQPLSDGLAFFIGLNPVARDTIATGIKVPIATSGNFTAQTGTKNGAALYEVGFNGTFIKVAESADLPAQWKLANTTLTNPPATFPFTSPVAISKNKIYVAAIMYNSETSPTPTAPVCAVLNAASASLYGTISASNFTNFKLYSYTANVITAFPSTIAMSSLTSGSTCFCTILY